MKKLLTILFLIVFSSNSVSETIRQDQLVEKDGVVYKSGSNQPFTGSIMDVYDNFQTMGTGTFKEGKRDGMWISFWKNGNVENEGVFKEGKKHGLFESFFENGQLKSKINYQMGEYNGSWEWFYPNGQIEQKGMFKNGKEEGRWEFYHENGQHKWVYHNYKNGKEDGLFESFDEKGVLETRGYWKDGELIK
jgi:antitoxin component YwqK of YwqJK toxin-antitoxin module